MLQIYFIFNQHKNNADLVCLQYLDALTIKQCRRYRSTPDFRKKISYLLFLSIYLSIYLFGDLDNLYLFIYLFIQLDIQLLFIYLCINSFYP